MKITLTGATGFVGKALMNYLVDMGHEVDYISTAEFSNEDWGRLDKFQLKEGKPEYVVHCAWLREKDLHNNTHMEFADLCCLFFDECASRGIKVINLGSSSEYGVKYEAMKEDMACFPHTSYGIAKLAVTLYAKKLGFNTLRIFSIRDKGGKSFASNFEKSEKWANPRNKRDYINLEQMCIAVQRLLHAKHIYGEIINLGSGMQQSNREVVNDHNQDEGLRLTSRSRSSYWNKYPESQYEPYMWVADTEKMKKLLNI